MFKGSVTREWRRAQGAYEVSRHGGKEPMRVWAPNYYDVICFDAEELAVRERYVRDNPRRWALKAVPHGKFRDGFHRGNLSLLEMDVRRKALRVSRRASMAEIDSLKSKLVAFDGVVFSTFFSPGERECLSVLLSGPACVVWVVPMVLPDRIPAVWTTAFLEQRALWISAFADEVAEASRASCEAANRMVEELADEQ